jgi:hypothetical protein
VNLEVDVMDGDRFTVWGPDVYQYRGKNYRWVSFRVVDTWVESERDDEEQDLDLPTFTRYCQGCGLTVKEVKPEPQVETIKPPEWAVIWPNVLSTCARTWRPHRGR